MGEGDPARVVWVTGAGGGLGSALVRAFLASGWSVVAAGHREAPGTPAGDVWAVPMDVRDAAAVARIGRGVRERWGRLDALVNNAGCVEDRLLGSMEEDAWDRVVDTGLKGAFLCSRAAVDLMGAQGGGHILNVASHAAWGGGRGQSAYAAAKAGLIGLTLALAREVGRDGICVNAVLPGVMRTGMTRALPGSVWEGYEAASVLGRVNEVGEVAAWVVALAASRHISGQVLGLDGRIVGWA